MPVCINLPSPVRSSEIHAAYIVQSRGRHCMNTYCVYYSTQHQTMAVLCGWEGSG